MPRKTSFQLIAAALLLSAGAVQAGDVEFNPDVGIVWEAGVDGVVIEWDADGQFKRIYSQYTQPVAVPNARGVRNAKVIAEEKAKANIIRFLEEDLVTERRTNEISDDIETSEAVSRNDGNVNFSTTAKTQAITSLGEFTSSVAQGTLRGVIKLEEGYDAKSSQAWVKVGFSNKTMRAAASVREAIENDGQPASSSEATSKGQSSHVRKSEQKDW